MKILILQFILIIVLSLILLVLLNYYYNKKLYLIKKIVIVKNYIVILISLCVTYVGYINNSIFLLMGLPIRLPIRSNTELSGSTLVEGNFEDEEFISGPKPIKDDFKSD